MSPKIVWFLCKEGISFFDSVSAKRGTFFRISFSYYWVSQTFRIGCKVFLLFIYLTLSTIWEDWLSYEANLIISFLYPQFELNVYWNLRYEGNNISWRAVLVAERDWSCINWRKWDLAYTKGYKLHFLTVSIIKSKICAAEAWN
jgi:hypothetical protein